MKSYLVLILSFFLAHTSFSCAYDGEYYQGHLFGSELLSDSLYKVYYDLEPYCNECLDRGAKANLMEWKQRLGTPASLEEIEATVYKLTYAELLSRYNMSSPQNDYERSLFKNKELLDYLLFAKNIEPLCQLNYEEWGDAPTRSPETIASMNGTIDSLKVLIPTIQDKWLKQRYVMNLIRLCLYSTRNADAISYYDQYVDSGFEKNSTYYRTLAYKGGAYRRNNELVKAKFTFAQVFDLSPDYRHLAYKNFKYIDVEDKAWNELVGMPMSSSEKACVWFMQEVYMGSLNLDFLKQIYKSDPGSARLEVAALRQINRMEESLFMPARMLAASLDSTRLTYGEETTWEFGGSSEESEGWWSRFWKSIANFFRRLFGMKEITSSDVAEPTIAPAVFGYYSSNPEVSNLKDSKTLKEALVLLDEMLENETIKNKPLYNLLFAYSLMVAEDYSSAAKQIEAAKVSSNKAILNQADFLETLLSIWENENVSTEVESKVLTWLKANEGTQDYGDKDLRRNFILVELGRNYLKNKRFDEAALAFNYSTSYESAAAALLDWYYSDGDMVRLIDWTATYPSDIMKEFGKKFYSLDQLVDVRATKLLRRGKFEEANELYKTFSDTFKFGEVETSFSESPSPATFYTPKDAMSRKDFTAEVVKRLKSGKAEDYMQIGNALSYSPYWCYNSTVWHWYGLKDALYTYDGATYPFNIPDMAVDFHNRKMAFVKQYVSSYSTEKYYRKAAELSINQEVKAEALFNAIQIVPGRYVSYYHPKVSTMRDSLVMVLKGDLKNTKYVQDALISCPEFAAYKIQ